MADGSVGGITKEKFQDMIKQLDKDGDGSVTKVWPALCGSARAMLAPGAGGPRSVPDIPARTRHCLSRLAM
jgi:hypothetical protein